MRGCHAGLVNNQYDDKPGLTRWNFLRLGMGWQTRKKEEFDLVTLAKIGIEPAVVPEN